MINRDGLIGAGTLSASNDPIQDQWERGEALRMREQSAQIRVTALSLAVQVCTPEGADGVLKAAQRFEAFITGADGKAH